MHPPAKNGFELVSPIGMQVGGGKAGAKFQPRADESTMIFHFIAANEEPQIRHPNAFHGVGRNEGAIEQ